MRLYTYKDGSQAWLDDAEYTAAVQQEIIDEVADLKAELVAADYKAIKHSEGLISDEDYAPIKEYRQSLRDRINELENNQSTEG